jgi:hypothetical protein
MQTIKGTPEEEQIREIIREEIGTGDPNGLTRAEIEVLRSLARTMGQPPTELEVVEDEGWDENMRKIVREEIAALAGKALRRTQDRDYTRSPDRNLALDVTNEELAQFWGEVLSEYGSQ